MINAEPGNEAGLAVSVSWGAHLMAALIYPFAVPVAEAPRPEHWQVGQALDAEPARKATLHRGFRQDRGDEREGQRHPDRALALVLADGELRLVFDDMEGAVFDPIAGAGVRRTHRIGRMRSIGPRHGRATPLLWLTVDKDELKDQRNDFEDLCLTHLKAILPEGMAVTILADRGFGDVKLFEFLESLGFGYVIRFRGNVHVTAADGQTRLAADWVGKAGRARLLRGAELTAARHKVGAAVCVHAKGMKEAWHLAASDATAIASQIVNLYAKRWTIEPGFRDTKDLRFGMGMSVLRIGDPQRRDRLLLLNALAILLLTLLGAAGESLGMDRSLRTSTVKRRVHSLFRQGCLLYDLIPNMPEQRLRPLVEKYEELLNQNNVFTQTFGPA